MVEKQNVQNICARNMSRASNLLDIWTHMEVVDPTKVL